MNDEARWRAEDRIREARYKQVDEELKVLADIKRYVVAALIAIAVGIFKTEDEVSLYVGMFVCAILLLLFALLIILRYQKIRDYQDE